MTNKSSLSRTKMLTGVALLTAVAVILQYVEFAITLVPSFMKLDFSDLPELIGAYAYGPMAGILITILKNLIHLGMSQSGFVGELSNAILGCVFAGVAGLVYSKNKTKKGAVLAGVLGCVASSAVSVFSNYFLIYPMYYSILHYPEAVVLQMYQAIVPGVKNIFQALLVFNVPFTFFKELACVVMALLIYKRITPILK